MKNYAKFCKIKIDDKKYQLNLTEGGYDTAHFIGRAFSVLRLAPILVASVVILKNLCSFLISRTFNLNDVNLLIPMGVLITGFCLPRTSLGNGFNAIFKCFSLKRSREEYYNKMRALEKDRIKYENKPKKLEKIKKQQIKLTDNLIGYFYSQTKRFKTLSKHYYKKEHRKGYVDGIEGFALENLEMHQEEIDKCIFHNIGLFRTLSPKSENFLMERFNKRYNDIVSDEPYYDEFINSIIDNDNVIKNDCIDKNETSDYLKFLQNGLNLKVKEEFKPIEPTRLVDDSPKMQIQHINLIYENVKDDENNNEIIK